MNKRILLPALTILLLASWDAAAQDRIDELERKIDKLVVQVDELTQLIQRVAPSERIVAFTSRGCPNGWAEYQPLFGRFIRGWDKDGNIDPNRDLNSYQDDAMLRHTHDTYDTSGSGIGNGRNRNYVTNVYQGATTGWSGEGSETRPKNVALLYCWKFSEQ